MVYFQSWHCNLCTRAVFGCLPKHARGQSLLWTQMFLKALRLIAMLLEHQSQNKVTKTFLLTNVYYKWLIWRLPITVIYVLLHWIFKSSTAIQISENNQLPTIGNKGSAVRKSRHLVIQTTLFDLSSWFRFNGLWVDFWGRVASLKDAAFRQLSCDTKFTWCNSN